MIEYIKTFVTLLVVDSVYLWSTGEIFGAMVKKIQNESMSIRYGSAFIVYALLSIGLVHFIVKPGRSLVDAAILGAVIYGVFDFTNYALFRNYGLPVAIMDTVWGSVLMALTAYIYRSIF
jgi:uncharacterized membrane protein